jgi:hypothetical protein
MSAAAWIFFLIGATFLWGGLVLSIANYLRSARRSEGGAVGSRQNSG